MATAELAQTAGLMTMAALYNAAVHHCMNLKMAHQPRNPLLQPQSQQSLLCLCYQLVRQVLPGSKVAKLQLQVQTSLISNILKGVVTQEAFEHSVTDRPVIDIGNRSMLKMQTAL